MIPLLLLALAVVAVRANFSRPPPFDRAIWNIGDTETIKFTQPPWKKYTVALWQQSGTQNAATLAKVIFETTDGRDVRDFDWRVQIYDVDLRLSDNFFLWMFPGGPAAQGNQSLDSWVSSKFTIRKAPKTSSTSSSTAAPTTTSSTALTTSTSSTTAPSTSSSTLPTNNDNAEKSNEPTESKGSGGLSSGATAGIAVAATVIGIALIGGLFLLYRRHKKRTSQEASLEHAVLMQQELADRKDTYAAWGTVPLQQKSAPPPPQELSTEPSQRAEMP